MKNKLIKLNLPKDVSDIIDTLINNGYEAFAVGGCVRDSLMGRIPHDWDITTSATPVQVKALFRRTIDTGIQHGTVTVMIGKRAYEITTYRIDGEYKDSRHPDDVTFTSNLIEDLKRRDFTINAMAYNDIAGVVDEFSGIEDLENGVIRCVGEPSQRFREDALRILRAVRFSAQLNFSIDSKTVAAIKELAPSLTKISKERIAAELDKTLMSAYPDRFIYIYEYGLSPYVLSGCRSLIPDHEQNCAMDLSDYGVSGIKERYEKIISLLQLLPKDHYIRFAALCIFEKSNCRHFLKMLKMDNATIKICMGIMNAIDADFDCDKTKIRKQVVQYGKNIFDDYLFPFLKALCQTKLYTKSGYEKIVAVQQLYLDILSDGDCLSIKDMALNGNDLINMGVERGEKIGAILNTLFEKVLENPGLNRKETLISMAKALIF